VTLDPASVVALQHAAGNRTTAGLIENQDAGRVPPRGDGLTRADRSTPTLQREETAVSGAFDPAYYDAGYRDGRAGKEASPGAPLDPVDMAVYYEGYRIGHEEAEKTQTSASPPPTSTTDAAPSGPLEMPNFLSWTPEKPRPEEPAKTSAKADAAKDAPTNFEPITAGPPASEAYERGVREAWQHTLPSNIPWADRADYAAGYGSALDKMEQGQLPGADEDIEHEPEQAEGVGAAAKEVTATVGGHLADESLPNMAKRYVGGHIPHVPYGGAVEMATSMTSDTPMRDRNLMEEMSPDERIEAHRQFVELGREKLRGAMKEHIKDPLEDEEPDASADATLR